MSRKGTQGERVVVCLDGQRAFDISTGIAEEAGLRKDHELAECEVLELLRKDEPFRAREAALKLLARRDRLGSEVVAKLQDAGFSHVQSEGVLAWLRELGYVDDRRYAVTYISQRTKGGYGRRRVLAELARKGLEPRVAREAWETWGAEREEGNAREELTALVERRFGASMRSDPERTTKRISGYLARRGHDWELIAEVVKAVASRAGTTPGER